MAKKIGLVSLGCSKNLVDSEIMLGILSEQGFEVTNDKNDADMIIINTCGFIDSAKEESINTILEMAELKKGKCRFLIVAGCLAERYRNEIRKEIPEVDAVIGTGNYGDIAQVVNRLYQGDKPVIYGISTELDYLENKRIISTNNGYAYLKIAEGCDNCCTYCIIPKLRGPYRSRSMESILREAEDLAQKGVKELVLIAQDTSKYGIDIYGQKKLVDLLKELEKINGIEWIRFLYCYPEDVDDALIDEVIRNTKVCNYFDIPIQHISDKILKMMGRKGSAAEIKALIEKIRNRIPDVVLRTTLMVGFPGENDTDFMELYNFVKEYKFDRLGVFTYSREEGTPADKLDFQVDEKTKNSRYNKIMALQKKISREKNKKRLGKEYRTIVEGVADDGIFYYGRTPFEAPEIDGLAYFTSSEPLNIGEFVNIKIVNTEDYDVIGEVTNEFTK
ncbi:MAG TPA: 30S ribosomal protein S12 methylthiotransferase RimO [Clostridiaceae bacterium]|nr:30S ribosomal protein S12 methylthiotransferase RimO [Clostridiaceae bacterium]